MLRDFIDGVIGSNQVLAVWSVDPVVARTCNGGRADTHVHFGSTSTAYHGNEAASSRSANDGIVYHYYAFAFEDFAHGIVLHLDLGVPASLFRLDERAPDIMVANEGEFVRDVRFLGVSECRRV